MKKMTDLKILEKNLLVKIVRKRAIIVHDGTQNDMYIALANGDRRCRPIAWLDQTMLSHLLTCNALKKSGEGYVVTRDVRRGMGLRL